MKTGLRTWCATLVAWAGVVGGLHATEIRVSQLEMEPPSAGKVNIEKLLPDEIAGVQADHIAITGPLSYSEALVSESDTIFLFIKGHGSLIGGKKVQSIEPETIALPFSLASITLDVPEGSTLHYVRIRKLLSPGDVNDLDGFEARSGRDIYFKKFSDCEAYTEAIKSPKTVSRTVLPKDHTPRVAMGTVKTIGPDKVGAHEHPMLDQLFLGLKDNDVVVFADDARVRFPPFSLLHIPLGSRHWVEADEGRGMYYMWMDFFLTKEGQEWLKMHKPIESP